MTALTVLLTVIVAGMNIISYNAVVSDADLTLSILSENKGRFPDMNNDGDNDNVFEKRKKDPMPRGMSPELPYESRYFSVLLNQSGDLIMTETSKIASVDSQTAVEYAQNVISRNKSKGFMEQFRFIRYDDNDNIRIIFLDCERRLESLRTFLSASVAMSLIGIAAVFLIICFFAGRIIKPIAQSYEKQKRFITDAGHEIKTPLTIINANADILEMELGENESLADIQQQTRRLKTLTDDLVMLARMEESEDKLQKIDFPISEIIEEAARPFNNVALQQKKQFSCNIQPMLSVRGNSRAVQKLAEILLDNAFKYSPEGGYVALSLVKQNKTVYLSVSNTTSTPINQKNLSHIFDRFYRTDESRNSETGGHGIGLSIAQTIVSAHNGKIHAVSHGEFTFEITAALPV